MTEGVSAMHQTSMAWRHLHRKDDISPIVKTQGKKQLGKESNSNSQNWKRKCENKDWNHGIDTAYSGYRADSQDSGRYFNSHRYGKKVYGCKSLLTASFTRTAIGVATRTNRCASNIISPVVIFTITNRIFAPPLRSIITPPTIFTETMNNSDISMILKMDYYRHALFPCRSHFPKSTTWGIFSHIPPRAFRCQPNDSPI